MIRCRVQSQWLRKSRGDMFASVRRSVCCAYAGTFLCARCVHLRTFQPWVTVKSPPTRGGNWCQGRMESSKRSVANGNRATNLHACQLLLPFHPVNYRAVDFVSDARFSGDAKNKFRIRRTKVGRLLEENPVVRVGQRKIKQRRVLGSASPRQMENICNDSELEHDQIDIHSPEGALQESLPTDEELGEVLSATHSRLGSESKGTETSNHSTGIGNDSESLNEFDRQYFLDAAHKEYQSKPSMKSEKANSDEASDEVADVDDRHEFDRQYFGNLQEADVHSQEHDGKKRRRPSLWSQSRKKGTEPVYMDSSLPEDYFDNLSYGTRTKTALEDFDKKLGRLFEDAAEDKDVSIQSLLDFEPHETATAFQRVDDMGDHQELTFINETRLGGNVAERIQDKSLKAKLEAERIIAERKQELSIGDRNLSDLEPEIIRAMKAVHLATSASSTRTKAQKVQKVFGTADPNLPCTDISCSGCGARFQAHDPKHPGFLPSEKYRELLEGGGLERAVCQRCWYLTHHKMALDVSVGENDYKDIITSIRRTKALVVVLVDLLDFPCSLIPNLKGMVGDKKPMVIVGNKADLLPKDSPDWDRRITNQLLQACVEAGVCNEDSVKHVCIVSAKSGFGIEDLITALQKKLGTTRDVYLLGTANVGKSTLFNRLLQSDYCKAKASWLISKATISRWPGTTLNLLRFPIVKPTPEKLALRMDRLTEEKKQAKAEQKSKATENKPDEKRLNERAYVRGTVGRSYDIVIKEDPPEEKELDDSRDPFALSVGKVGPSPLPSPKPKKSGKEELPFPFRPEEFDRGRWFYDTPGMIHDQQILTKLTSEELKLVVPKTVILPRTVVLKPGNTIFLGGMGRLDYLEGRMAAFFTIFASKDLPMKLAKTVEADEYYQNLVNKNRLMVPLCEPERMKTFPALQPVEMMVTGQGWQCSSADVLFSSAGWAAVTAANGVEVCLRAYTPGGHGCLLRRPALLPHVVNLRGDRISKKSPYFKLDKKKLLRYL
ncbi:nitric oxide-associated protein 1-like [Patiria miniata]|uniref:Nitric oxide-associated protein 1 n=1 Tax=Patiria miniata TaxID=46514 RepID=A0A914B3N8_PATMI|nr:nitric oxide-associated protein 1-like [Patiria miniata]XP_038070539.1 nitric oxide-associated protein 1-like [Patiria miniata]XP_038070540.1 nitric oxide-associated protein 1-like [Patiria miniata]